MTNAAAERGNYIDELGESLNNATMSASNYLSTARNAAVSPGVSSVDDNLELIDGPDGCR